MNDIRDGKGDIIGPAWKVGKNAIRPRNLNPGLASPLKVATVSGRPMERYVRSPWSRKGDERYR